MERRPLRDQSSRLVGAYLFALMLLAPALVVAAASVCCWRRRRDLFGQLRRRLLPLRWLQRRQRWQPRSSACLAFALAFLLLKKSQDAVLPQLIRGAGGSSV